jgi:hypothetical protein
MLKHPEYREAVQWNKPRLVLSATDDSTAIETQTLEFVQQSIAKSSCLLL